MTRENMKKVEIVLRYLIATNEGAYDALIALLLVEHEWLICCSAENPEDVKTYVLENVTRYEIEGHFADIFKNPTLIEYGISQSTGGEYPYRIHDSLMSPIKNGKAVSDFINSMLEIFDVFIIDDGMIVRKNVWGKLGTAHSEKIVFINDNV